MEEKKKNTGIIVLVVVLVLCVFGLSGYIIYDKVLSKHEVSNNTEDNVEKNDEFVGSFKTLSLKKEKEEYKVGNYKLTFIANDRNDDGDILTYLLNITYNNSEVKNIFGERKGLEIYHDDFSMTIFKVRKIQNVYIFINELGMPGYNETILIMDDSGHVLKEYEYAHNSEITDDKIIINYNIDESTRELCGEEPGKCIDATDSFTISGFKLIK